MGKPTVVVGKWKRLVVWAGGVAKLARRLRIRPEGVWRYGCAGSTVRPTPDRVKRINAAAIKAGMGRMYQ
jgi:hypothetical protein